MELSVMYILYATLNLFSFLDRRKEDYRITITSVCPQVGIFRPFERFSQNVIST
jgi:hypothetical protein